LQDDLQAAPIIAIVSTRVQPPPGAASRRHPEEMTMKRLALIVALSQLALIAAAVVIPVNELPNPCADVFAVALVGRSEVDGRSLSVGGLIDERQGEKMGLSKTAFEIIEGKFHDGLGTYAEQVLANELIALKRLPQPAFDTSGSAAKMRQAIAALPISHPSRATFQREISNVETAAKRGASELLTKVGRGTLTLVRHVPREFAQASAGDVILEFSDRPRVPISVKTDKSGKVAVAEGQTPDIGPKWAERYFKVSEAELNALIGELGFSSLADLKSHYLNVARLVAEVMVRKLELTQHRLTDFSQAKVNNLDSVKHLFRQLLLFKKGNDQSHVIIFDRATGDVKWESLLDAIDIDNLTPDRISFLPSRPRGGRSIGSEFGIKVDGKTVVSFQVKHKRGRARGTPRQYEFSDITTRLRI
jgi:hypothetical protein